MDGPLINLQSYTPLEMILFAGGCYIWVVVYILYIRHIMKHRMIGMPVFAAASNIAWELVWGFVPPATDMGLIVVWGYRIWFFLDLYIFAGVVRMGATQVSIEALRPRFKLTIILTAVAWTVVYYFFKVEGFDTVIGAISAYVAQSLISVLYLLLLLRHHRLVWFSLPIAWLKMLGSGLITVFMFIHYPANHFLQTVAAICLIVDCVYIGVYYERRRSEPITRAG
ncbi:MAG TPA: hypothetical protein VMF59_05585 [Bacteroidota bacterium]|nr:hypothetical protein [Bacteroidota bacterium]